MGITIQTRQFHSGMSKKKVKSIMKVCASKEEWLQFYNDEENFMLNIVDLHPQWCGGVEILAQQFNSIHNSISDADKRLNWISVNQEQTNMEDWKVDPRFPKITTGAEPKFVLFLKGKIVDVIIGANTPALEKSVNR